jgi:large subunit ribosomal protein L15
VAEVANELSTLKPPAGAYKKRKRVGRGEGSGTGRTAGKGQKGQLKRGKVHAGFEGGQMPLHRRLPKRGFNNIFAKQFTEVRLDRIASHYSAGEVVDATSLKERGLIKKVEKDGIKVLGNGDISVAVTVRADRFTASAAEKIQNAGGTVERV